MNKLLVIIPAYNEERHIEKVLSKKKDFFDICVVDDNSSDSTKAICRRNNVILISNKFNIGYESSINLAFEKFKTKYNYILTCDADDELNLDYAAEIFTHAKDKDLDILVCNRDKFNRFSEKFLSLVFKVRFNIKDPLSGMKLYKTASFLDSKFDTKKNIGVELLMTAIKRNMNIMNYEITTKKRSDKSKYGSNLKTEFKILSKIIKLCFS